MVQMSVYWNQAQAGKLAHATEFRNAVCGTHMGYGSLTWVKDEDTYIRKCARCVAILKKRESK
jgi:hypothetical protein